MPVRRLTLPEALVSSAWCALAVIIAGAYLWARVARLEPFALFGALLAAAVVVTVALVRGASRDTGATIACGALLLTIAC